MLIALAIGLFGLVVMYGFGRILEEMRLVRIWAQNLNLKINFTGASFASSLDTYVTFHVEALQKLALLAAESCSFTTQIGDGASMYGRGYTFDLGVFALLGYDCSGLIINKLKENGFTVLSQENGDATVYAPAPKPDAVTGLSHA